MKVPTRWVTLIATGQEVVINEKDFNERIHVPHEPPVVKPPPDMLDPTVLSVKQLAAILETVDDPIELDRIKSVEGTNETYPGGRASVLKLIAERHEKLKGTADE